MTKKLLAAALAALATLTAAGGRDARAIDLGNTRRAHRSILRLDVADAREALAGQPADDPDVLVETALLQLYEGDFDAAVVTATKPEVANDERATSIAEIARGSARAMAATTTIRDDVRGIEIRLQDDDDAPLVPFFLDVADSALAGLSRDLGVDLPRPLHIVVVRDHFTLAAMTGLPLEAAQTTGTVAVAKWGRVTIVSPRAAPHGYPWADTLMHELTHLAVTRASVDRAPLWLQEGVAKREETRWRAPSKFDDVPSADAVAKLGFEKDIALPLDKLGPSIAMLPTAQQAQVAFAEVQSFVRYWIREEGEQALPKLLVAIADAGGESPVDTALTEVSGMGLSGWSAKWQKWLMTSETKTDAELLPGLVPQPKKERSQRDVFRAARLGELLAARGHDSEAVTYLARAEEAMPRDPSLRGRLALSLRAAGRTDDAEKVVESLDAISAPHGLFFAMHGWALRERGDEAGAETAFRDALELAPFQAEVACEAMLAPLLPRDPAKAVLCGFARSSSQR